MGPQGSHHPEIASAFCLRIFSLDNARYTCYICIKHNSKEVGTMKAIARRIEEMFTEIAFAEEREIGYLKDISGRFTEEFDNYFTAITFAEAGELDAARDLMGGDSGGSNRTAGFCVSGFCTGSA
jgi:hypothetical protein